MPGRGSPPLVGRERELRLLHAFVDEAAVDGGARVIAGEAGVGKTALADSAADYAAGRGMRVLRAAGVEFEAEVGFAGLHQLLAPLLTELAGLNPTYRRALAVTLGIEDGPAPDRLTLVNSLVALLTGASDAPVLVVVDDAHWLDQASASALATLARRLKGNQVAFIAAVRSEEPSLFHQAGIDEIAVAPLDDPSAEMLMATIFPRLPQRAVRTVLGEAQGNPLALIELPVPLGDDSPEPPIARTPVGRRLRQHFERLIGTLPAATRAQLLHAALDGSGDVFPAASAPDLGPAERAGLVRIHPLTRGVQFRHPLTRSSVVELATDEERRIAHRELADRYPADSERHAWHLAAAAIAPDEQIARLLEDAALRSKRRGDPVGAIGLLMRSAELSPGQDDHHRRAMFATYLGADVTGDLVNPRIPAVSEGGRSHTVATAVAAAAYMVNSGGDADAIHRVLLSALRSVPKPLAEWNEPLAEIVYVLMANGSFGSRADLVADYWNALDELGLEPPENLQLLGHTFLESATRAQEWLPVLDAAIAAIDDEFDTARAARLGIASMYVDRTAACRPALWRLVDHGRAGGAIASAIKAFALLGFDAVLTGDWDAALRIADEGLNYTDRHHYRLLGGFLRYAQAMVAAARGDDELARRIATELVSWGAPNRIGFVLQLSAHVSAVAALTRGDYKVAYGHVLEVCSPETLPSYKPAALWMLFDLVESAVRAGRMENARAHVADICAAHVAKISPRLALVTAGAEALVATGDDVTRAFEAALALPGAIGWPFLVARIRLGYGERLRRMKSTSEARRQLMMAAEAFDSLRAVPWAARARGELRATGWVVESPAAQALTPQEREIAALAAAGLTNKQIGERLYLSPRTVSAHLYHLFPKLGVTSRAALRDALREQRSDQV
ncbi:AAA family ATPase [Sinomonas sp. ASV322]|uniref:AAA family ATPase n=1 Tax=Sinomonas sp. ASV322 TaxID=3041920 RepID=UPI0027DAB889|nr:AAA family ATPase [Sinomonas sp. ASV322]MDQ4501560.1 AAA family ATPase [Sinomonas sp. ASV322]